jgi:hypothetical protein
MKTIKEQHQQWCVHYQRKAGLQRGEKCKAGICYDELVKVDELGLTGSALRLPCIKSHHEESERRGEPLMECTQLRWPTERESDVHEREWKRHFERMEKALGAVAHIRKEQKGKDWQGKVKCPVCESGELMVRHSGFNGHIWAKCSTSACVAWIE